MNPNKADNDASIHGQTRCTKETSGMDCRWKAVLQGGECSGCSQEHYRWLGALHSQACRPGEEKRLGPRTRRDRDLEEFQILHTLRESKSEDDNSTEL